jgi:hypothetical protein
LAFFNEFDLDLVAALAEQLVAAFDGLEVGGLTEEHISTIPSEQGVYQLFRDGTLVYVGKADSLRSRLRQHRRKIGGRQKISVEQMGFKCLTVRKNWTALAPETSLIAHYKEHPELCEWNGNGFGIHDPGRERETTNKHPDGFDSQFPIRDDWSCAGIDARVWNGGELLAKLKKELPYLLRYDTKHKDYGNVKVNVPNVGMSATEILTLITKRLPGWQATRFPSHMILYKEHREYEHGIVIWYQPTEKK